MKNLKITALAFIIIFFSACSHKNIQIKDIKEFSQDPSTYTKKINIPNINQKEYSKIFLEKYFSPWEMKKLSYSKKEASWAKYYLHKKFYFENQNVVPKKWLKKQISNSNFEDYNTVLKKAISIKNANIRVFPTSRRFFYNPLNAGEGYPFDYNQNSLLKINTPLIISHYSKDKAWAFVQSHFVIGWIRVDKLKIIDNNFINKFKTGNYYVAIKEAFPIFGKSFIDYVKVGTIFPKNTDSFLLESSKGLEKIKINSDYIKKFPIKISKISLGKIAKEFINEPYGWGGVEFLRDCSSFTQDYFTPFGIYLNRNSKAQTLNYKYIDLSKMSNYSKKNYIKNNAIPFFTLVYMPGHIMLYIGNKKGEPLVMHNTWGVKTWEFPFKEARNIIGRTVITTLKPGIELKNVNKNKTLLNRIKGIVLLNQKQ